MRLRQAVLHPSLVLKRLSQNLEANKKLKGRSASDRAGDIDEEAIKALISGYGKGGGLDALLDDDDQQSQECAVCFDVSLPLKQVRCASCSPTLF